MIEILLPNPRLSPKVLDFAHAAVTLQEILRRGGVLVFPPSHPVDVYVTYRLKKITARHAVNVVRADFRGFYSRRRIVFSRQYGYPNNTIDCPYRSRNIARLIFNQELSPKLGHRGPRWPWALPHRFERRILERERIRREQW